MNDEEKEIHNLILDKVNILDKKVDHIADQMSGRLLNVETSLHKVLGSFIFLSLAIPIIIAFFAL